MSYLSLLGFFTGGEEKKPWFKYKHESSLKCVLPSCCISSSGCRKIVNRPSVKTSLRCLSRIHFQSIQTFCKVFLYLYRPLFPLYSKAVCLCCEPPCVFGHSRRYDILLWFALFHCCWWWKLPTNLSLAWWIFFHATFWLLV